MSKSKYADLTELQKGKYDWKIKIRVTRIWRGITAKRQTFKSFNLMLLDSKDNRIHAFVPTICADELECKLYAGKVYVIRNFTVQDYKMEDKYRCLRKDVQLIFSNDTQIKEVEDDDRTIAQNAFDLYDHGELKELAKQTTYLADVIGIIKFHQTITDVVNRHGDPQKQSKFTITDGRSNIKVTLWDSFALKFEKQMLAVAERPVIIILSSCRVGIWNDEVDLGNVSATECFLNYNHYSVAQLRKLLNNPAFSRKIFAVDRHTKLDVLTVSTITTLGPQYMETEVLGHLSVCSVEKKDKWYHIICTSCNKDVEDQENTMFCNNCNCQKPYPEKKYKITVHATDETGGINVVLGDQQVRTIIRKRVADLIKEAGGDDSFPKELKKLVKAKYTMKLLIKELNVVNKIHTYWATNICHGFIEPSSEPQTSTMQASNSSYHLDGMSQLGVESSVSNQSIHQ